MEEKRLIVWDPIPRASTCWAKAYPHELFRQFYVQKYIFFCGRVPWLYQYLPGGFMLFVVLCPGTPEGSTGSVLVLKRLKGWGNGLKSHPTDWEKPGIEPATPGLQDIGLSPTPQRLLQKVQFFCLWPCSLAEPVPAGWVYGICGSMSRNSRRLNRQWFWF